MNCKQGTSEIIRQITDLLETIDDKAYHTQLPAFKGSTIGQHFRHIADFYTCFINGLHAGVIDYAARERDPQIETHTEYAIAVFQKIADKVAACDESRPVEVKADFSDELTESRPLVRSSVGRELMYAYDHAVHHLAIIKIGLRVAFPDIPLDEKTGVAPSTLKYWKTRGSKD
ncbi:MAG: DinB family protein [Bacteroidetes bacterium]|nr:MAG: DinB family protein [Bacteroidota bacterium]